MKKYKELDFIEKKIAARKHAKMTSKNGYSFPIFIIIVILCYIVSEYINSYIIAPFIILSIIWYFAHEIKVRKWYDNEKIKITKKDIILYGTEYEIFKKLEEKEYKDAKKKRKEAKSRRTKKNI